MNGDNIIAAADRLEQAANDLGAAYQDLQSELAIARKDAWRLGGTDGAADVNNVADPTRVAEEVGRYLVGAGLTDVLEQGRAARNAGALKDLTDLWRVRLAQGKLTTNRRRDGAKVSGTGVSSRKGAGGSIA